MKQESLRPRVAAGIVTAIFLAGCAREPERVFVAATEAADLPERHQQNIRDGLTRLFGTPSRPRIRVAAPEGEQLEDDVALDDVGVDAVESDTAEDDAEESDAEDEFQLVDTVDVVKLAHGAAVYTARCAGCHGISGDGNGPAAEYLVPKPRDYRRGVFKFTSTPYGRRPARQDLVRTIRRGAKGTSMPAFPWMSDQDLAAVIDYVIYLSKRGEVERFMLIVSEDYDEEEDIEFIEFLDGVADTNERWEEAENQVVLPVTAEPAYTEETVVAGRRLFLSQGCAQCHGADAKGQTAWLNPEFIAEQESLPEDERIKINYDAWNDPGPAADITARLLHGGRRPIDIYRRIYTGINGTPMPAFGSVFTNDPDHIWSLVHYVRHIIEGGDPQAGVAADEVPAAADEPVEND